MKLFPIIIIILNIFIFSVDSYSLTSKSVVDKLYGENQSNGMTLNELKNHIKHGIQNGLDRMVESLKSPKGFKSPDICIWKICSKPLKKVKKIHTPKKAEQSCYKMTSSKIQWFQKNVCEVY
jgi:phage-related protein